MKVQIPKEEQNTTNHMLERRKRTKEKITMPNENINKKSTPETQEISDREFDWNNSIGVFSSKDSNLMDDEVDKIGWEAVRKRLAGETRQDTSSSMRYYPPR